MTRTTPNVPAQTTYKSRHAAKRVGNGGDCFVISSRTLILDVNASLLLLFTDFD